MTSKEIEIRPGFKLDISKIPDALAAIVNLEMWAKSIVLGTEYKEPDPNFVSRMIAMQTITATSIEEVFAQQGIKKVQEIVADAPGAAFGPITITDLYVAESDFETGNPSYVILTTVEHSTGNEIKMTTGATNIQATLIGLMANGMWPITCQIKRGESKDRGGRYLLFLLPPD